MSSPSPQHLGRVATRRLRSASMETLLARTLTTRPRSCQAGPAQQGSPPARTWPRLSDLAPGHPAGSRRTPGRDTVAAKSTGNALVAGSPDLSREAGSVRSQPTCGLASGPAADATDGTGTRRLPRGRPTASPTDPFSFPEWGSRNLGPRRQRALVCEDSRDSVTFPKSIRPASVASPGTITRGTPPTGPRTSTSPSQRRPAPSHPVATQRLDLDRRGAAAGGSGPGLLPATTATKLPQASRVVPGAQPGPGWPSPGDGLRVSLHSRTNLQTVA